ncbi:V-type ATP synthase subunit I [Marinilabilia rubra]|uniref:V-type ATP synthase subunit I n=1 Tax=Marinilabilia rubra TaxID=2162893 RepID=A0A2U2BB28_9BACT|nr:V-type ATPase 116kDa subunit family protein [Marinilabilia rubra]PWE00266.1 V-type ATP synthase subunit I [Marinilabilia rubra]
MIVPMFKYSFLVFHADYDHFLEHLKDLGVAHIVEHQEEPTTEMQDLYREVSDISKTIKNLESRKKHAEETSEQLHETTGETLNEKIRDIESQLEQARQHLASLQKEEKQLAPWGYFSKEDVQKLGKAGLTFRYLMCSESKFDPYWKEKFPVELISESEGYSYFVLVLESKSSELPEELTEVDEVTLPEDNLEDVQKEISSTREEIDSLNKQLDLIALKGINLLENYKSKQEEKLSDLNVRFQTVDEVEGKVRLIEAWVPEVKAQELEKRVDNEEIYFIKEPAKNHEKPPIMLKNNRFARLFEPVSKLFSLPAYVELDMTPFFAPFFMMFFGFCLGDAGYGLLLVLAATLYKPKAQKNLRPILTLVQFLGLATVIFGAITGTFFGINMMENPPTFMTDVKNMFLDNDQMFNLALIFGGIQILFGMILKAINQIRQHGIGYSFATWGWFILIVSSLVFYYLDQKNPNSGLFFGPTHMAFVIFAALGILVFNHPKRNIFVNIGAGLWDAYNMVTGVVGDLLSYIRLFALGLASAILGRVFNQLAFDLAPDVPLLGILITLIILLAGHGINIFMSGLGSFVHPLRLTFVEFYKNAGFIGGGKEYKPFQKAQ